MADKFDNDQNELLISLVKARPLLWDKSSKSHRNMNHRSAAWREVCKILCSEYECLSRKERYLYTKLVIKKWTNLRDTWRKSFIDSKFKKKIKPYVYHDNLKFLEKNMYYGKESSIYEENVVEVESEEVEKTEKDSIIDSDDTSDMHYVTVSNDGEISRARKRTIEELREPGSNVQVVDVKSLSNQTEESPHISFIHGILPALNKLNDDEVLEFQGGVIQLLQNIRKRRTLLIASEVFHNYGLPSSSIDLSNIKENNEEIKFNN